MYLMYTKVFLQNKHNVNFQKKILLLMALYLKFAFCSPNGSDLQGSKTLGDSKVKLSRRDLQILVGVFLIDIIEY